MLTGSLAAAVPRGLLGRLAGGLLDPLAGCRCRPLRLRRDALGHGLPWGVLLQLRRRGSLVNGPDHGLIQLRRLKLGVGLAD